MKLASLKDGTRDGRLAVVSRDLRRAVFADAIAATMQAALESWTQSEPKLRALAQALEEGRAAGAFAFDAREAESPLPRAYQWLDGSVFPAHGIRMEKAFNLKHTHDYGNTILMYQGLSDDFFAPTEDVVVPSEEHGIDFEGEIAVVTDEVPMGTAPAQAAAHIKLVMIANDVSLRAFGPVEMKLGFGFLRAKPPTSFSPVAVTPDELGAAWKDGQIHLPLHLSWNGKPFGHPMANEMASNFFQLVAHAATTRKLSAGTIIGSGTVSNLSDDVGQTTIAELRAKEMIAHGEARTAYMKDGDTVRIEMKDAQGQSIFGAIDQKIAVRGA